MDDRFIAGAGRPISKRTLDKVEQLKLTADDKTQVLTVSCPTGYNVLG